MSWKFWKQEERLEDKCVGARINLSNDVGEIEPYSACKKCPEYVQYGAAHFCLCKDYLNKKK